MPRRKRHRRDQRESETSTARTKREQPFFRPFQDAAERISPVVTEEEEAPPPPPEPSPLDDDEAMFADAMAGVAPLGGQQRRPPAAPASPPDREIVDDDRDALIELSEFVAGQGPFDIVDTDEHVEGAAQGLDPRILKRLRKGEYSVAAHIDLHGKTREEAKSALNRFVGESRRSGKRCVLVVHGRGLHSKDQRPVLKEAMVNWLGRTGLRKQVLGFCTARPYDGGAGALYVLLRR